MADHDPSERTKNNPQTKNTPKHSPPSNLSPSVPLCTLILGLFVLVWDGWANINAVEVIP